MVLVLDEDDVVVAASRRARDSLAAVVEGEPVPPELLLARMPPASRS